MADLVPAGYLSLTEVHARFLGVLWNGYQPRALLIGPNADRFEQIHPSRTELLFNLLQQLEELENQALVRPFADGVLQAFVRIPGQNENFRIPPSAWRDAGFPEMLFLSDQVRHNHGAEWESVIGRTPFVEKAAVEDWLDGASTRRSVLGSYAEELRKQLRDFMIGLAGNGAASSTEVEDAAKLFGLEPFQTEPDHARYDPMALVSWDLPMTVAWIAWRRSDEVRQHWGKFRERCWAWRDFEARLPHDGGREVVHVAGEELVQWETTSVSRMSLGEILATTDPDYVAPLIMPVDAAMQDLTKQLANGDLQSTGVGGDAKPVLISRHEWAYLLPASDPENEDHLVFRSNPNTAAYTNVEFNRQDVCRLWPAINARNELSRSTETFQTISFDDERDHWTLFEACLWVGCEWAEISSDEVASNGLHDLGAAKLFEALFREKNGISATGVTVAAVREDIPSVYWEMASTDPDTTDHLVSFVDDLAKGYWGTLTPKGENEPRWSKIEIRRKALKQVFVFAKAREVACRHWLESLMRESPHERPMTKPEFRSEAQKRFGLGRAGFDRAWLKALDNVPEAKENWTKGGRPKNPTEKSP